MRKLIVGGVILFLAAIHNAVIDSLMVSNRFLIISSIIAIGFVAVGISVMYLGYIEIMKSLQKPAE